MASNKVLDSMKPQSGRSTKGPRTSLPCRSECCRFPEHIYIYLAIYTCAQSLQFMQTVSPFFSIFILLAAKWWPLLWCCNARSYSRRGTSETKTIQRHHWRMKILSFTVKILPCASSGKTGAEPLQILCWPTSEERFIPILGFWFLQPSPQRFLSAASGASWCPEPRSAHRRHFETLSFKEPFTPSILHLQCQ